MPRTSQTLQAQSCANLALALVETCVRNSRLEELHTGISPASAVGDYSDVKVVTPYGEIPWAELSRLDDAEMKGLMIEVVDRVYTFLTHPEPFLRLMAAGAWQAPAFEPAMMDAVARYQARARGATDAEIWKTWPLDEAKRRGPLRREAVAAAVIDRALATEAPAKVEDEDATAPRWTFTATPESLRALADAPIADAAWIAKAREALALAADGWESAQLQVLDEIEAGAYGLD